MYTVKQGSSLGKLIKTEKNPITLRRLTALSLLYEGCSPDEITKGCQVTYKTLVDRWLKRWNKDGYDGLVNEERSGRPSKLSSKQKQVLREYVMANKNRVVCKDMVDLAEKEWGITCDRETIRRILLSMKLSWQKPNKVNHKSNSSAQKVFKKSTR